MHGKEAEPQTEVAPPREQSRSELLLRAKSGDRQAAEAFIEANLGLVHMAAGRFTGKGIEYEDLVQIGAVGLVKAYDRFDITQPVQFSTYAVPVILGELRRAFRDGGAVKVSRHLKELGCRAARLRPELEARLGREATVGELAQACGASPEELVEALDAAAPVLSLSAPAGDSELTLEGLIGEDRTEALIERLSLSEAMARLPAEDRLLIEMRFFGNRTQAQTAQVLGVSQVQISRREKKALASLRALMTG